MFPLSLWLSIREMGVAPALVGAGVLAGVVAFVATRRPFISQKEQR